MSLPQNYSPSIHKRQVIAAVLNPLIKRYIDPLNEVIDGDISSPAGAILQVCLIDPKESLLDTLFSMMFFAFYVGFFGSQLSKEFYGTPKTDFKQKNNNINSQILFYFEEPDKLQRKRLANRPKRMQFSVSLRKDATLVTRAELNALVEKIKIEFPPPSKSTDLHYCGHIKYSYYDPSNGIQLKGIQAVSEGKAIEFITSILNVFDVPLDKTKMNEVRKIEPINAYQTEIILGSEQRKNKMMVQGYISLYSVSFIPGNTNGDETIFLRPAVELDDV